MDGLSIGASVVGILSVSLQTSLHIIQYARQLKTARKDIDTLKHEVKALHDILLRAKSVVRYHDNETEEKQLTTEFKRFQDLLEELEKKLERKSKALTGRFTWSISRESISNGIETARRYREMINTRVLIQTMAQQRRNEYYEWFLPPDASRRHNDLRDKRHENTGHWFSDTDEFKTWKTSDSPSFVWIYGIPGCGKSVLASRVIDTLVPDQKMAKPITPFTKFSKVYFYFDFSDKSRQKSDGMIRSLIWQLATDNPAAENVFTTQLSSHWASKSQPTTKTLLSCLRGILKEVKATILVVDALDECQDQNDLLKTLKEIVDWQENLKILVTSRREVLIEKALRNLVIEKQIISLQGDGVDKDIRVYIQSKLQDPEFERWHNNTQVQVAIEEKLVEKAAGMFRWVECQFFALRDFYEQDHDGESLRDLLNSLPDTLDETYERILTSVPRHNWKKALRLLQWLSFSARALTVREVAETMAIDVDHEDINQMRFNSAAKFTLPCEILKICPGMINTIITTGKYTRGSDEITEEAEIRLAHFSVKEYLQSDSIASKLSRFRIEQKVTNRYQAHACLVYVAHLKGLVINEDNLDKYPFASYSAQHWHTHVRDIQSDLQADSPLVKHVQQFLDSKDNLLTWVRLFDPDIGDTGSPRYDAAVDSILSPLYYASDCGLFHHVKTLITRGVDVEVPGGSHGRPLRAASKFGYESCVRILLDAGASAVDPDGGDRAVIAAAESGNIEVIKMLIENEEEAISHPEAADAAFGRGRHQMDIAQLLLGRTGWRDVNAPISRSIYGRLLQRAATEGITYIVPILLDMGAEINAEGGWYGTALRGASLEGEELAVRMLLERGADPHLHGNSPGSPLLVAIAFDRTPVFDLLLQYSLTNVNNDEGMYGTSLQEAASQANPHYVRKLLEKGAAVNTEGGLYHTALQAASFKGHIEIVNILLDNGARPDVPDEGPADVICLTPNDRPGGDIFLAPFDKSGVTPDKWHTLRFRREPPDTKNEDIIRLLRSDPVVTVQKGMYGSALRAAVAGGHPVVVKRLLDANAKVDECGGALRSIWEIAQFGGNSEIQQLLRDAGVKTSSTYLSTQSRRKYTMAMGAMKGEANNRVVSTLQVFPYIKYPEPQFTTTLFHSTQ